MRQIVKSQVALDEILKKANGEWVEMEIQFLNAELRGNSHAELRENSHAVLWGNSHAKLWENSHAILYGNSHAVLWGNSHAELRGNSHAELRGNSHAELRGNSHAELWENSHAVLWENSHANAWDFASCYNFTLNKPNCGKYASIINIKYPDNIKDWCAMKGIKIKKDRIYLWKTVNKDGKDFYSNTILYATKKEIIDPKWDKDFKDECGAGLHLADCPSSARYFCQGKEGTRLFKVSANINDCRVFGGMPDYPMKLRAKKCRMVKEFPIDYEL